MRKMKKAIVLAAALMLGGTGAFAEQSKWNYRAFVYLWTPELGGTSVTGQDMTLSFSDILDNLDFGLMGALEANKGPISIMGDFQYLDLSSDQNAAVGPGIPATADADVSGFVFTGSVGYDFKHTQPGQFVGFGGFRYLGMDTTANLSVGTGSQRVSGSISNFDAIIGVRGVQPLSEKWALSFIADVGAGDSDLTWQAGATFDRRINNWNLSFGYRHIAWEIGNSNVVSDLSFSGPIVGAKIAF
ncbi:hypothetical protein [Falsiruegeria litorea]|uniref:Outer membrane protein beta-barrel domain-containing protein n=1 Tax=Falsiruegeria litorea TaxID=1280831 RepID=A0ABS5WSA7_9RHOB|nr:hypothetical protein [Falsiruegeria litorea]MBT3142010.1 hypothetical protein [Falsiruegeria litorea]MBT8168644.1 hypothetical protein [Falsiruegeria litorea]